MIYPLSVTLKERQLLFFGKIIRSPDTDLKKIALLGNMKLGKRTVGGQYKTYEECIINNLKDFDLNDTWYEYIQHEAQWKQKLSEQKDIAYQKWITMRTVRRRIRHNNRNEDNQNMNYGEIRQQTMERFDKLYKYTLPKKKRHYKKIKMEQKLDKLIHIPATVHMFYNYLKGGVNGNVFIAGEELNYEYDSMIDFDFEQFLEERAEKIEWLLEKQKKIKERKEKEKRRGKKKSS